MLKWRFTADDGALFTSIGERDRGLIRVSNPGCGLFGPYIDLPAGNCGARILLHGPREGLVEMDISAENGGKVLISRPFDLDTISGDALGLSVELLQSEKACEVRLHCHAGARVDICGLEIDVDPPTVMKETVTETVPSTNLSDDSVARNDEESPHPGVTQADVVASIEMILGHTPDQALIDYHLRLGFPDRFALGQYMLDTDAFRARHWVHIFGGSWEERAQRAVERKNRLMSFGPHACGLLVDTKHGVFAVDPEDGGVSGALLVQGYYNEPEYDLAKSLVSPDGDVLIVGAHIGVHAVPLSKSCNQLLAIEANPRTFQYLQFNLRLNQCSNVLSYNVAAGDKAEKIQFLLNRDNSGGSKRAPSFPHIHYVYDNPEAIEIETVSLDLLLGDRKFDLILMDIEGSEYFALKGMQRILAKAKVLSIEFLPHHLKDVANVEPEEFIKTILPHFDFMYIPGTEEILENFAIQEKVRSLYESGTCYDGIYFFKERPTNWI